jgi:hypothetical protein
VELMAKKVISYTFIVEVEEDLKTMLKNGIENKCNQYSDVFVVKEKVMEDMTRISVD